MSLYTASNRVTYAGNGSTTAFPFAFRIPDASHLSVIYTDAAGNETTLSPATYSVTGIGIVAGGVVTYPLSGSALASGKTLTLLRTVPLTQPDQLSNQGGYYPEVVEDRLDRIVMALQQLDEKIGRVDLLPAGSQSVGVVSSLSDLKALTSRPAAAIVKTGLTADVWQWEAGSATTADDVLVVEPTSGEAGRYKRLLKAPYIYGTTPQFAYGFAGYNVKTASIIDAIAASNTTPEFAGSFQIVSNTGFANDLDAFKIALTTVAHGNPGTSSIWGAQFNATLAAGVGAVYAVGLEIDLNISNQAYSTVGAPYATNLLLTGTSAASCWGMAGIVLAYGAGAGAPLWNYGLLGVDYTTHRAFRTAFISDQSRSPTILHSDTAHTKGVDFASATFSGNAWTSPGASIGSLGAILGLSGGFGLAGQASQSVLHTRASAASFQIVARAENDNAGSGSAALGFSVTSTAGGETRSAKAGIFFSRGASNGRGTFGLANRISADTTDFAASNYVMQWDSANAWQLSATHFTANGSVATTTTSLGPTGSQTTIQEWLTVKNAAGTVRYIPCY